MASAYAQPLVAREKLGSTAIGKGIALPHGKTECLPSPVAAAAVLRSPANFNTPDGVEVDVVIAFLSPDGPPKDLGRIADIVRELRSDEVRLALRRARKLAVSGAFSRWYEVEFHLRYTDRLPKPRDLFEGRSIRSEIDENLRARAQNQGTPK